MSLLKLIKIKYIAFFIILMLVFCSIHILNFVRAENVIQPGSDGDPIITKSYVDKTVNDLLSKLSGTDVKIQPSKFEILQLKLNQQLIVGESTELVIRTGKAKAIASNAGGLADVTIGNGSDILTGADIPLNHLILISRNDGRGIKVVSASAWVLVKGTYTIK